MPEEESKQPVKTNVEKTPLYKQLAEKFLKALSDSRGIIYVACNNVGINRSTYYDWLRNYPEFKEAIENINEATIDFVESKLIEKIEGIQVRKGVDEETKQDIIYDLPPSDTACIFYLKTKGKKRGYVERMELGNVPGESFNVTMDLK